MPKRPVDVNDVGENTAKRFHPESNGGSANECDQIMEEHGSSSLCDQDGENSQDLIKKITDILDEQQDLLYKLYPTKRSGCKIEPMIKKSIQSLRDQLADAEKVKLTVAVFGKLGKGKSYLLNHVLRHGLDNEEFNLLPSGWGDSKTPVPIRIRYGESFKVRKVKKDGCEEQPFSTREEASQLIERSFEAQEFTDLLYLDVSVNLPVFEYFQNELKSQCHLKGIDVEVEFVDLPGEGDNHGNALIGRQLDNSDVILLFKEGESGRPVTFKDLQNIFRRRKVFDFANRPSFVVIENDKENKIPYNGEEQKKEQHCLEQAWDKLIDNEYNEDEETDDQIVHERLPLTTAKYFLEKFKTESKAIIFGQKHKSFLRNLSCALSQHVNNVIIKKNIHPVLLEIHQNASIMGKRISALLTKHNRQGPIQPRLLCYLENSPVQFQFTLGDHQDDNFKDNLKSDFEYLNLKEIPNMLTAHKDLMDLFQQETTVQYLTNRLRAGLLEYCQIMLDESKCKNESRISDPEAFAHFAERSCKTMVNSFIKKNDGGQNFVKTCLKKIENKKPGRLLKKQWTTSKEEERKLLLEEHCDMLCERLFSFLSKGSRRQAQEASSGLASLVPLCKDLHKEIDGWMLAYVNVDDNGVKMQEVKDVKTKNKEHKEYSKENLNKVNPHPNNENKVLDSTAHFPDPLKMHNAQTAAVLPPVNHTLNLEPVFKMLQKRKKGVLNELRKKLKLPVGTLPTPNGKNEFEWSTILLRVLYNTNFHHKTFGEHEIPGYVKLEPDDDTLARQQLFAFQYQSAVSCQIEEDESEPDDVVRIKINESKDGLTATANAGLKRKLEELKHLKALNSELVPIFIPSIHYGPRDNMLGNLYLEDDPWKAKDDEDNDKENTVDRQDAKPATGLENLKATIFCVVEPDHLENFKAALQMKPPNDNIDFLYVVLPQNGRGIGVSRSVIKILAETLKLRFYWTIDDDVKSLEEYNKNEHSWRGCTTGRALLYGQRVIKDCIDKTVIRLEYKERMKHQSNMPVFPEWAIDADEKSMKLLLDNENYNRVIANISSLDEEFNEAMMQKDCGDDPAKVKEWCETKEKYIIKFREIMQPDYKRIGRVSIGNVSGRRSNYHSRTHCHYRKSCQNYQMVLHNTEAIKGFNYVTDDVLLRQEEGTVHQKKLRDVRHYGHKWEDKSFCKALEFYGVTGYQIITLVQHNEKLRNAFGRVGNSYLPEEPDRNQSDDESDQDLDENEQDGDSDV